MTTTTTDIKELNRRHNLPAQEEGALLYNSCDELRSYVANLVLPPFEFVWSNVGLIDSELLDEYSEKLEAGLPRGYKCEFDGDAEKKILTMKSVEAVRGEITWCYVERTIFLELVEPYASLDMVALETTPTSFNPTEGPNNGMTFVVKGNQDTKLITYDETWSDHQDFISMFQEEFVLNN